MLVVFITFTHQYEHNFDFKCYKLNVMPYDSRIWLLMLPKICFSFSFESAIIPIYDASAYKDCNGKKSFLACVYCLLVILFYYFLLFVNSILIDEEMKGFSFLDIVILSNKPALSIVGEILIFI